MQAQDTRVEPMRFHGPGWSVELESGTNYQLWAPQDGVVHDPFEFVSYQDSSFEPRDHWAACWQSDDGEDGDFVKGETMDGVLRIFPRGVARLFREAIDG